MPNLTEALEIYQQSIRDTRRDKTMDFNYEKAWFVHCLTRWNNLDDRTKKLHYQISQQVADRQQNKQLDIPVPTDVVTITSKFSIITLAKLARLSYFAGHWNPGKITPLFENKKGQSWKVANVLDQILTNCLNPPYNIKIHEGKFRVTFSNRDCWLWEEFGLATKENLEIYKKCGLTFDEDTFKTSAQQLKTKINDLWKDPEDIPNSPEYTDFLTQKTADQLTQLHKKLAEKLTYLDQKKLKIEYETKINNQLIKLNISPALISDNLIYYSHTNTFCFGWKTPLTNKEKQSLVVLNNLKDVNFEVK